MLNRGYSEVKERVEKNPKYVMSCFNCNFLLESEDDPTQEECSNNNVLKYDMIVEENGRVYCHHWKPVRKRESKNGRR